MASNSIEHRVHMSDVRRDMGLSIKIDGIRSHRIRLWLGVRLLRFAAWVMGMTCTIEITYQP